jgi:hypothetical protein
LRRVVLSTFGQSSRDQKRNQALSPDIKACAVQNKLRLKTELGSQNLR